MVFNKEAYGGQKQALNISLTLQTVKIVDFRNVNCLIDYCKVDEKMIQTLWNLPFSISSLNRVGGPER